MPGEGAPEDIGDRPALKAAVAGFAILCGVLLAAGMCDGPGAQRPRLHAAPGARGPAPPAPLPCFHGPRGEPVDFSGVQPCPPAGLGWSAASASR